MTKRSSSYVCTVDANDPQLAAIIDGIKSHAKMHNAKRRVHELESPEYVTSRWSGKQQVKRRAYICVRGRLGKSNPNAELYSVGGKLHTWISQDIKLEHSQRVDIYVSERRNYTPVAG